MFLNCFDKISQKYILWIVLSATIDNFDIFLLVFQDCLVYE